MKYYGAVALVCAAVLSASSSATHPSEDAHLAHLAARGLPSSHDKRALTCPGSSSFQGTSSGHAKIRPSHPRLLAGSERWSCLTSWLTSHVDPYLTHWDASVMQDAHTYYSKSPTKYVIDGGYSASGVLDVAREVQLRVKYWGYAYKMTGDSKWVDRTWKELVVASGNTTQFFGVKGDNWNSHHFLDVGEFTLAFGIAYDWMFDAWTSTQRKAIMWSIITLGLKHGIKAYENGSAWWSKVNGNWNCVTNNGLVSGALAIIDEDPTGSAKKMLDLGISSAAKYCAQAIESDGTWSETPNYWYFGTTSQTELAASLQVATGNDGGLFSSNSASHLSGLYHMYVTGNAYGGPTGGYKPMFAYGDAGPNKYVANANALFYMSHLFSQPTYALFQREAPDAPDVLSLLWYDPQVSGTWWSGLELDHHFPHAETAWTSMRASWSDATSLFVAMKHSKLLGHQTHGDLDAGDFVLDAFGQRFAGEYGSGNYLSKGYFSGEQQDSLRWLYFRKRTEGQNTLMLGGQNQLVTAAPTSTFGSTGDAPLTVGAIPSATSAAYVVSDLSSAYAGLRAGGSVQRGIRLVAGRSGVLLQDEIVKSSQTGQWRIQTNATVSISNSGHVATLKLGGHTVVATIRNPNGLQFTTTKPVRLASDPPTPSGSPDQANPGVTVLVIAIPKGSTTIEVLFSPQWSAGSAYAQLAAQHVPPTVPLSQWSITSHN